MVTCLLPLCFCLCLSVCLADCCLPVCLSVCLSVCLCLCLCACLPACLSVCLCLPACLSVCVTARVWCRGRIDRKRNSTINLTTDSGACYLCLPQISPLTPDVTTNNFFTVAAGERQNIFEKLQYHPAPHTPNGKHSSTHIIVHSLFFPISPFTLFHFLGNFLTSWTLPFLRHFLFLRDLIFLLFSLGTVIYFTFLSSWVSNPPIQLG